MRWGNPSTKGGKLRIQSPHCTTSNDGITQMDERLRLESTDRGQKGRRNERFDLVYTISAASEDKGALRIKRRPML